MKSSAPETGRSPRASRTRSITRRSRQSLSSHKEDVPLETVKTKWNEILDEEGVTCSINIVRANKTGKSSPRLDTTKPPLLKIIFCEEDNPVELHVEGDVEEREILKSICSLFSSLFTITVLRLVDCKIKAEGILVLGSQLSESGTVKELYLDLNPISGEDYSPLLENTTLEVLSLKGCAISGVGAELISEKLTNHHMHLRALILNTNLIDDQGAIALSNGLKWSNRLICLSLAGNIISSVGAINILSALREFLLDEQELEKRKEILYDRAQLILAIVNERKEAFFASLPPMPALPAMDFPQSRKYRRGDGTVKGKKKSETRVFSKSQRVLTSSSKIAPLGEKTVRRSAVGRKDKGRLSEQVSSQAQASRSHVSMKPPKSKSSMSAISESFTADALSKYDHDVENDTIDLSDDDSIYEFSRFENMLADDWDHKDNKQRYKEKMLKKLCQDVGEELFHDPAFQDTFLSRVFMSVTGKLYSRGNLNLTHLNLAYNKIREDVMTHAIETIRYQKKIITESGTKKGIRTLMFEGNLIPHQQLVVLNDYVRPSSGHLQV